MKPRESYKDMALYLGEGVRDLLDRDEEIELIRSAQEGICQARALKKSMQEKKKKSQLEKEEEERTLAKIKDLLTARNKLVERNLRLVASIANQYLAQSPAFHFCDLLNEGSIGLMRAIEGFNESFGTKLSTYATWWIHQNIQRALNVRGRMIAVPDWILGKIREYRKIISQSVALSLKDIALQMGITQEEVSFLKGVSIGTISLTALTNISNLLPDTRNPQPEMAYEIESLPKIFESALMKLTKKEREIIEIRFGLNGKERQSLAKIGKSLKVTKERIRQIEFSALNKLRNNSIINQYRPVELV